MAEQSGRLWASRLEEHGLCGLWDTKEELEKRAFQGRIVCLLEKILSSHFTGDGVLTRKNGSRDKWCASLETQEINKINMRERGFRERV